MIGQIVHSCQDTVSKEVWTPPQYFRRMAIENEELLFNQEYCSRVKRLREGRGMTSEEMAVALGIPSYRYRKYESRSPLPQYLIERFAIIVGRDIAYVITGRTGHSRLRVVESGRKPG